MATSLILFPWTFQRSFGISDDPSDSVCKMETDNMLATLTMSTASAQPPAASSNGINAVAPAASSGNATPTNASPILTPKMGSPVPPQQQQHHQQQLGLMDLLPQTVAKLSGYEDNAYQSEASSNASSISESANMWQRQQQHHQLQSEPIRANGQFRTLATGLEPIPEDDITDPPAIYQPLVPPMIAKPATTSYNISFPTTLQPRDRYDFWTRAGLNLSGGNGPDAMLPASSPGGASSSIPPSPGSHSSQQVGSLLVVLTLAPTTKKQRPHLLLLVFSNLLLLPVAFELKGG